MTKKELQSHFDNHRLMATTAAGGMTGIMYFSLFHVPGLGMVLGAALGFWLGWADVHKKK